MSTLTAERYQLSVVLRDLKEKNATEYEKHLTTLQEINKENTNEFVEAILSDKTTDLAAQLKVLQRISNLITSSVEAINDRLLLQLGELQGIVLLATELIFSKEEKKTESELLQKHLAEKYTETILKHLYLHPSTGHKELADTLSVSVSHLSEILAKLIEDDLVRKTRQSKYSFYSLSYQANEYTRTQLMNGTTEENAPYLSTPFSIRINVSYGYRDDDIRVSQKRFVNYIDTKEDES